MWGSCINVYEVNSLDYIHTWSNVVLRGIEFNRNACCIWSEVITYHQLKKLSIRCCLHLRPSRTSGNAGSRCGTRASGCQMGAGMFSRRALLFNTTAAFMIVATDSTPSSRRPELSSSTLHRVSRWIEGIKHALTKWSEEENMDVFVKMLLSILIPQTPGSGSCCLPIGVLQSMWATWCKM